MKQQKVDEIKFLVDDEQELYTSFSPDDEFREPVKTYLRAKVLAHDFKQPIQLTVISPSPIDEVKFKSAIAHWVIDEKAALDLKAKHYNYLPGIMFTIGTLLIIVLSLLKPHFEPVTYAILFIIGTAVLGKGVQYWYENVPILKASRWLAKELEKKSSIVFKYGDGQDDPNTNDDV